MRNWAILLIIIVPITLFASQVYTDNQIDLAHNFINYLSTNNFNLAQKMFNSKVANILSASKLMVIWKSLQNQFGKYNGILSFKAVKDQDYITVIAKTKFEKAYLDMNITFDSNLKIAGFHIVPSTALNYSVPSYVNLNKFTIKKVQIGNNFKLPAELTIPKGKGPFIGVVLIPGSGPSDMDETIGPNKPFKDLAYGLSSNKIVVLRYDKRSYVYKNTSPVTPKTIYFQDAKYAIEYLQRQPFISKIFVIGHSLGAYLLPEIAKENGCVSGIIMLASPARSLAALTIDQLKYIANLDKNKTQEINLLIKKLTLIKEHKANPSAYVMGAPASYYYDLEKYPPVKILKNLSKPVLICQGGKDYQVTSKDFDIFKDEFNTNKFFTFKFYNSLSHIFTTVYGKPKPSDYYKISHIDINVIKDIINWLNGN